MDQKEDNYVAEPCDISEIGMDTDKMRQILKEHFTPLQIEYIKTNKTQNLRIDSMFAEFLLNKIIGGELVGEGNFPVDIIKNGIGIDVCSMCMNGAKTNEKSIMQKFGEEGNNLDNLFLNDEMAKALDLYKECFKQKMLSVKAIKNLKDLYYFAFISTDKCVYGILLKINLDSIFNIKYESITKQEKSIKFSGFIDKKFGRTTLFKSKKRLELKLNKYILEHCHTIKLFELDNVG